MTERLFQNNNQYASTRHRASSRTARGIIGPLPVAKDGFGRGLIKEQ